MSGGEVCHQVIHLHRLWDRQVFWGDTIWLHHQHSYEEAKSDVPCEGEYLSILWGGVFK